MEIETKINLTLACKVSQLFVNRNVSSEHLNTAGIGKILHSIEFQRSRGRQIRRPGTRKLVLGRIILPRDDSRDARFFRRETSQSSHLYLGFVVY